MSNKPKFVTSARKQAREVKAVGCIKNGVKVIRTPFSTTVLPN